MMAWLSAHYVTLIACVGGASMLASAIAAMTPTPKDDKAAGWIKKVYTLLIDIPALNVGKAKAIGDKKVDEKIKEKAGGLLGGLFRKIKEKL